MRTYHFTNGPKKRLSYAIIIAILVLLAASGAYASVTIYRHVTSIPPEPQAVTAGDEPIHVTAPPETTINGISSSSSHDSAIPPIVNGLSPVINHLPTKQSVVFLGIDDGANKQAFELQLMQQNNIKASLFLAYRFINNNPTFFKDFVGAGSLIEDHTLNHKTLTKLSYTEQKQEICGDADLYAKLYGRRPILFRPPGGSYNTDTQKAAAACGMKAVVLWVAKANGGSMQYQKGHSLKAGDIVLMHFRPEFAKDMQAFVDAEKAAGLHTELLENWL